MYEVRVEGLMINPNINQPVLILVAEELGKAVSIKINMGEALGLLGVMGKGAQDKPKTYELFYEFIEILGAEVSAVEIIDIYNDDYSAKIVFDFGDGNEALEMDGRAADAVALALKFSAPIYVSADVMDSLGEEYDDQIIAEDASPAGKKWAEYLKNLNPEDFGKYRA